MRSWEQRVADPSLGLAARIEAAMEGIESDPCLESDGVCVMARFALGPEHLAPDLDPTERVLVVDDLAPSVDMLRYRHRILGFHRFEGTQLQQLDMEWALPEAMGRILTAFAQFPETPAEALEPLRLPFEAAYRTFEAPLGSHGLTVHRVLTDAIPDRGLVFLDYNGLSLLRSFPELACAVGEQPGAEAELLARARALAAELSEMMDRHNVTWVNASFGFTTASITGPWERTCSRTLPSRVTQLAILEAHRPIFDVLFGKPGILVVNAALQSPSQEDAPFDIERPAYAGRLRVGAFGDMTAQYTEDGRCERPADRDAQPRDPFWADVYVNSGCGDFECREQPSLSLAGGYGMGRGPFPLTQSSFVAPLLLVDLIRLRATYASDPWSDTLIGQLVSARKTSCEEGRALHVDPLLHAAAPTSMGEAVDGPWPPVRAVPALE
jgi:hypothetical protein